mgnify:FL=1
MAQDLKEYQKALAYLNQCIADGTLSIGSRLPTERALAEKLSISRNSTREAMRMLENSGVIESRRGSGNYLVGDLSKSVAQMLQMMLLMNQTDKVEIVEFRRSAEKAICFSLIALDNCDWVNNVEDMLARKAHSTEEKSQFDKDFHYALIEATGNHFWITIMGAIGDTYQSWISEAIDKLSDKEVDKFGINHHELLEAIKKRDKVACEKAIDKHYDAVLTIINS